MSPNGETSIGQQDEPALGKQRPPSRAIVFAQCLVLVCMGAFVYLNSLAAPFIFDDIPHIVERPTIRRLWPADYFHGTRRFVDATFALNYAAGGLDVRGYRAVNVAIHLCAGLVLFGLVRHVLLLPQLRVSYGENAHWFAFAIALLWTVHPLQTQSVTYIIQRYESMMGLFYLLCLYCLVRGSQARRGWPWYLATIVAFYFGMGSKLVMATAPVVAVLFDRILLAKSWREVAMRRWWVYAGMLAPALLVAPQVVRFLMQPTERHAGFGLEGHSPLQYLLTQAGVIVHYVRLSLWPDVLCLDYAWPAAAAVRDVMLPGIAILLALAASFFALRCCPGIGFLGLTFFVVLAPTSSIVPIVDRAFEHRMYLPLACVVTLAVFAFYCVVNWVITDPGAKKAVLGVGILAAVVGLSLRTMNRNRDYVDPLRIWQGAINVNPNNPRAHFSAAMVLRDQGQTEAAKEALETALRLNPQYARAHANLASLLAGIGDDAQAMKHFERAIELEPDRAFNWFNYGNLYARCGEFADAAERFAEAVRLDPQFAQAHQNLGESLYNLERWDESAASFRHALELGLPSWFAKMRLAWLLAGGVDSAASKTEALELATQAEQGSRAQNASADPEALDVLAAAHAAAGEFSTAIRVAERAQRLALAGGKSQQANEIGSRIELYQDKRPFHLPAPSSKRSSD